MRGLDLERLEKRFERLRAKARISTRQKVAIFSVSFVWLTGLLVYYLHGNNFAVLNSAGEIARKERELMIFTVLLGVLVVLPVFALTFFIAWRYREGNTKAKYSPNLDHNLAAEALWWGIPAIIILVLSVVTWQSSHSLDPHKPLESATKPLNVQVIALDWKWLFIYPDQGVASLNQLQFPEDVPVNFKITADAPMNSFWIPQLGGQIYAMPGMSTRLNLMADKPGNYRGSSANLSGEGFAGMDFDAKAVSSDSFKSWVADTKKSRFELTGSAYTELVKPSQDNPVKYYSSVEPGLYDKVIMRYMGPGN